MERELSTKKSTEVCIFTCTQKKKIFCLGYSKLSNLLNQELLLHVSFETLMLEHILTGGVSFKYILKSLAQSHTFQTKVVWDMLCNLLLLFEVQLEDSGNMFLWNVDTYLTIYTVPQLHLNIHCCNSHLFWLHTPSFERVVRISSFSHQGDAGCHKNITLR